MSKFWDIRNEKYLSEKGLYVISTSKLAREDLFKVGYSGSSLKNRLTSIREILSPSLQEPLLVYGLVIPKPGKSGIPMNQRAKELNEIEKLVHKSFQEKGLLECFCDSHRYSEWVRCPDIGDLFECIENILSDDESTYRLHFRFMDLIQ